VLLLFVVGGIIFLSRSYALFKKEIAGRNVELKVGELSYNLESEKLENNQITLKPNSSETFEVTLTSKNEIDSKYELYYKIISPETIENTVDGGYLETSTNPSSGVIESMNSKTIKLVLNNTGIQEIVVEIGVQAGLIQNDIILNEGEITLKEINFQKHYVFDYTGDAQTFIVSKTGTYKVELWGAGHSSVRDSGAYVSGNIQLQESEVLYLYIGQIGQSCNPYTACTGEAWNGGGAGGYFTYSAWPIRMTGGSGATDIRLTSGTWNNAASLRSRIMVAGGSGASSNGDSSAGGLIGYTGSDYNNGTGGTQIAGGTSSSQAGGFGYGGKGRSSAPGSPNNNDPLGGGSGYYGGGGGLGGTAVSAGNNHKGSGGGGSSFISGHAGCIAIKSETDQTPKVTTYSKREDSYHYSGKIFTDTVMIDGQGYNWTTVKGEKTDMPTHDLTSTMTGNAGNGYARITYIGESK